MRALVKSFVLIILATVISLPSHFAVGQEEAASETGCANTEVVSVPSRPSFSNGAATTQCGVLEVEYGWNQQWSGAGVQQDSLGGGLRLGLTPKLDFHWSSDTFSQLQDGAAKERGFGDTWLGFKYRFLDASKHRPALGILYLAKIPSASESKGLGSGQADHAISFLASRDLRQLHFDFNAIEYLAGSASAHSLDRCTQFALTASMPLRGRLAGVVEGYGASNLNSDNPAFASTMAGLTYEVNPRLVLDAGLDVGVTHDAPHKRAYAGVTYAIGNAYAWLRSRHQ